MDKRLLALSLGMFALGTDSFVIAGVLPRIAHAFGVSIGAAAQMTTIYALTYALLAPTIAALAGSVDRKGLLLCGLAVFVVANLATAAAPTFAVALLTRVAAGLGAALFAPTATGAASMLVPPERRGFALAIVVAGLTSATALGSPLGALIGGLGDWRWTMVFVSLLGIVSAFGIWAFLPAIPLPPSIPLGERLSPLLDGRVGWTLLTTLLAMAGVFTTYTYISVVFDRVIQGSAVVLGGLLVVWGAAGTVGNLLVGRVIDSTGSRKVIVTMLALVIIDMALMPWSGASIWTALPAIAVWGGCSWSVAVPQQHRLVGAAPALAPVVLGLNTSCTYLGVTAAGVVGAAGIRMFGVHALGFVGAGLLALALAVSELATRCITAAGVVVEPAHSP